MNNFNIPYQKEKIDNAICYFASEHSKKAKKPLHQTGLYKYLAFLDFRGFIETGRPILGLCYRAMRNGPVPTEIYNNRENLDSNCFEFINNGDSQFLINAIGKPNLDYFSKFELDEMSKLIEIFANDYVKAKTFSDASHEELKAW